jgi:hypothetical protein
MTKIFALGQLNRCLKQYENEKLNTLDKRLLMGFYIKDKQELANDIGGRSNSQHVGRKTLTNMMQGFVSR